MRKIALLGLVVLASGCGHGWLPLFRGAPCRSSCGTGAPAMPASYDSGCTNCGTSAGYSSDIGGVMSSDQYSGEIIGDTGYYGAVDQGGIINNGYSGQGIINSPTMRTLPANP